MQSRVERARHERDSIRVRQQYDAGIWLEGERCRRDVLFRLSSSTMSLGTGRRLHHPDLVMPPTDRIALTGANGSGKSTLIRHIMGALRLEPERVTYLPQGD